MREGAEGGGRRGGGDGEGVLLRGRRGSVRGIKKACVVWNENWGWKGETEKRTGWGSHDVWVVGQGGEASCERCRAWPCLENSAEALHRDVGSD